MTRKEFIQQFVIRHDCLLTYAIDTARAIEDAGYPFDPEPTATPAETQPTERQPITEADIVQGAEQKWIEESDIVPGAVFKDCNGEVVVLLAVKYGMIHYSYSMPGETYCGLAYKMCDDFLHDANNYKSIRIA